MIRSSSIRYYQSKFAGEKITQSPYPSIVCGDFNDVPNSGTYFNMKGNLQDAFLKKGFGIGRTFSTLSPTLRIDYIFADQHFRINQFTRVAKNLSDHFMIMADVELNRK